MSPLVHTGLVARDVVLMLWLNLVFITKSTFDDDDDDDVVLRRYQT
jgi:hypothetical protein